MIESIKYSNAAHIEIQTTLGDGRTVIGNYPSDTHYDATVQAWIDEGNTIAPYDGLVDDAKALKYAAIDSNYQSAESATITIGGKDLAADKNALAEITSIRVLLLSGEQLPVNFTWIDTSGDEIALDDTQVHTLFKTISVKHYSDAHNYARLRKQVENATTVAEVEAVPDW